MLERSVYNWLDSVHYEGYQLISSLIFRQTVNECSLDLSGSLNLWHRHFKWYSKSPVQPCYSQVATLKCSCAVDWTIFTSVNYWIPTRRLNVLILLKMNMLQDMSKDKESYIYVNIQTIPFKIQWIINQ